jgi:hypothetical protein
MARDRANILAKLREQMGFLRTSLCEFYGGNFSESVRIATTIRVLVHETGSSTPLLVHAMPNGLELPILDQARGEGEYEEILGFAVGVRMGPSLAPAVDLGSSNYSLSSVGSWWNRTVFTFPSRFGTQLRYRRKQVVLNLANKESGAHVDENEDPDYRRLMTDLPLSFEFSGVRVDTPDLARFLSAQSGVEILDCLRRNFFPDEELMLKWEFGVAPPVAQYMERISVRPGVIERVIPRAEVHIKRRN